MNTHSVPFFNNEPARSNIAGSEIILASYQLKNPENLGHIIRLAHNIGAKEVLFIGEESAYREAKIRKVAGMSFSQVTWKFISADDLLQLAENEFTLVALETSAGSKNLFTIQLPPRMILLGGNEIHGLPAEIISECRMSVHIPMPGGCKSMNISHALAVGAFEWYRQYS